MANYDIQVVLQGFSGLSKDVFVNTLHYEINAPDTVAGTANDIWTAYEAFRPQFGGLATAGHRIKVYEAGPAPRQPVLDVPKAFSTAVPAGGPSELACCLSYATVDDVASSTPRRRGRIYVGPLAGSFCSADRPSASLRTAVRGLGVGLADAGNAGNSTWLMYSVADATYEKIESIWTDDAWDVQRRRGLAPLAKQVQDVQ